MDKSTNQTAIAIANCLIGSALLIFPLNYMNQGLLENIFFLFIMGISLATTCAVYGMHLRPSEQCIMDTIKRILGEQYYRIGALLSGVSRVLISSVYFLLAAEILYDVIADIFGDLIGSEKIFRIILMIFFIGLTFFKDLTLVFEFSHAAMGFLVISCIILVISVPQNLKNIDRTILQPKSITLQDLLYVASLNGLAFTCHTSISPMLKHNKHPSTNTKAIFEGYGITIIIYLIVGVFGSLAIYGKHTAKTKNVLDYFQGQWQAIGIGLSSFFYLVLVFPLYPYVGKGQLSGLLPTEIKQNPKFSLYKDVSFAVIWSIINLLFIIFDGSPRSVMKFLGAVVGFYFVYYLPVLMAFKAGKTVYIEPEQGVTYTVMPLSEKLIPMNEIRESTQDTDTNMQNQVIEDKKFIIKHSPINKLQKIGFCAILLLGGFIMISSLIQMFKK